MTDTVAFQNLATAAGGAANIDTFCAKLSAEATEHANDPSGHGTDGAFGSQRDQSGNGGFSFRSLGHSGNDGSGAFGSGSRH